MSKDNPETLKKYAELHQVVAICHAHGVQHVVLCPGSRSAPLALSFMRFKGVSHYIIPDERSAAYTALGMSRQLRQPVALVCTSGTAALNFAPAIAEAYFCEIPLVVFTADRPEEWLGQADNQAIFQEKLYGKHVKAAFTMPTDTAHSDTGWYALRIANEAMNTANEQPKGPVHINVPLREPLYLAEVPDFSHLAPKIIRLEKSHKMLPDQVLAELVGYKKILVVAGTHRPNEGLKKAISTCIAHKNLVFVPDITSNLIDAEGSIAFADSLLDSFKSEDKQVFTPDLVISFGGPIVSKSLKNFLRNKEIKAHWHLSGHTASADTFQRLTNVFDISAKGFFEALTQSPTQGANPDYLKLWTEKQTALKSLAANVLGTLPYGETKAMHSILLALPNPSVLHLGNSLPIRYATAFPFIHPGIEIYSNRGTSGIDGTVSAAAGHSMADDRIHTLTCGDLAFMYDSNGLWNNYLKGNLKIIIFNNHGGGIFRSLHGAKDQPELEEYFAVKQPLRFEHTALQHSCKYFFCNDLHGLNKTLPDFYADYGVPAILEIEFDPKDRIAIGEVVRKLQET